MPLIDVRESWAEGFRSEGTLVSGLGGGGGMHWILPEIQELNEQIQETLGSRERDSEEREEARGGSVGWCCGLDVRCPLKTSR